MRDKLRQIILYYVKLNHNNIILYYIKCVYYLARLDRVYKIHRLEHTNIQKSADYRSKVSSAAFFPAREIAEEGANSTFTVSIVRNRMAMTVERYWANFRILYVVSASKAVHIRFGYFSDIDTLVLRGIPGIEAKYKDSAVIQRRAIRDDGRRVVTQIERECGA